MQQRVTIMIADDHLLFIEGLKSLFRGEPLITVLDVANDGRELLHLLQARVPDVVLLDINMPYMNGIDVCRFVRQSYASVKVIMLSTYHEEHLVQKARQSGAHGYLLKTCNKEELLQTLFTVHRGGSGFPEQLPKAPPVFGAEDNFLKRFNLTKREVEILRLIKGGCTSQEIAGSLFLSVYTVETHRKNINQKLGLNKPGALLKFLTENSF